MENETQTKKLEELMPSSNVEAASENYEEIILNEQETFEALRDARQAKYYRLKREAYNARMREQRKLLIYSSDELFGMFHTAHDVDEQNIEIVQKLCYYFTDDERFEGDLRKGLLLVGGVGIGKTTLMEFFRRNQKDSYRLISCRDIESDFSSEGEKSVQNCSYNIEIPINSNPFGHTVIGFCFDDLGTEANAKHYGHEKNVMAEIILNRYDNRLPYTSTHITTNLKAAQIVEQYGSRVADRMREMFNVIEFDENAPSRRK